MSYVYVFLGGGLGSLCRYALAVWFNHETHTYAWGTLVANVISCVILGAGVALLSKALLEPGMRLFLLVGFCGGFSTFSTFSLELLQLLRSGQYLATGIYLVVSVIAGLLAIMLGMRLLE